MGAPRGWGWRAMSRQMARGLGGNRALKSLGRLAVWGEGATGMRGAVRPGGRMEGPGPGSV